MSKITIIRDSTQISSFLDCPQMWKLEHDEQLALSLAAPKDAMTMGSYGHRMLEIFYKSRARRESITTGLDMAMAFNPDNEFCKCQHAESFHINGLCALCVGDLYTKDKSHHLFTPAIYPLDKEQRELVKERVRLYIYTYAADDFIPDHEDHVEVGFSEKIFEDDNKLYILEGKMDLVMPHRGMKTWCDHKFQLSKHDLYEKDIQFRNYDLVAQAPVACINYIRLTKKVDTTTYERKWFGFSKPERDFWRRRLIQIYDKMYYFELNGITPNDYQWNMCKGKFKNSKCAFTALCEESFIPDVVKQKKIALYHIKPKWKPWEAELSA
jgi:hypothetical protein